MSLQEDFRASGLEAKEYILGIWAETELTEDAISDIDPGYLNPEDIEQTLTALVRELPASMDRKDFYKRLVLDFVNQDNGTSLKDYCSVVECLDDSIGSKRELLANLFTRVLRGELVSFGVHRHPEEANAVLLQRRVNPWCARVDDLISLEQGLQ